MLPASAFLPAFQALISAGVHSEMLLVSVPGLGTIEKRFG